MKIIPMSQEQGGSDFNLVELADDGNIGRKTPHCKVHRAMNKVSLHEDGGGFWRCLQGQCRAGCLEVAETSNSSSDKSESFNKDLTENQK